MIFGNKNDESLLKEFGDELVAMTKEAFERDLTLFPLAVSQEEFTKDHFGEVIGVFQSALAAKALSPRHFNSAVRDVGRRDASYAVLQLLRDQWGNFEANKDKGWKLLHTLLYAHNPTIVDADNAMQMLEDAIYEGMAADEVGPSNDDEKVEKEIVEAVTPEQRLSDSGSSTVSAPKLESSTQDTEVQTETESEISPHRRPIDESYHGAAYLKECGNRMDAALGGWEGSPIDSLYAALWKPETPLSHVRNDIFKEGHEEGYETPLKYAKRVAPGLTDLGLIAVVAYRMTGFIDELNYIDPCDDDECEIYEKIDIAFNAVGDLCEVVARIVVPEFDEQHSE